jgi:hypothetical protein
MLGNQTWSWIERPVLVLNFSTRTISKQCCHIFHGATASTNLSKTKLSYIRAKHLQACAKYCSFRSKVLNKNRIVLGTIFLFLLQLIARRRFQKQWAPYDSVCREHFLVDNFFSAEEMKFALFGDEAHGRDDSTTVPRSRYLDLIRSRMTKPNFNAKRDVTRNQADFSQVPSIRRCWLTVV